MLYEKVLKDAIPFFKVSFYYLTFAIVVSMDWKDTSARTSLIDIQTQKQNEANH